MKDKHRGFEVLSLALNLTWQGSCYITLALVTEEMAWRICEHNSGALPLSNVWFVTTVIRGIAAIKRVPGEKKSFAALFESLSQTKEIKWQKGMIKNRNDRVAIESSLFSLPK